MVYCKIQINFVPIYNNLDDYNMFFNDTTIITNNITMPKLALGTWCMSAQEAAESVKYALKIGYRHIDTALAYSNEEGVSQGILNSGIDRAQIFVTTKIPAEVKSVEGAIQSIKTSLKNLNIGYIDLLLIHAPMPWNEIRGAKRYFKENLDVWGVMEKFYAEGTVKAIGVSNFKNNDLDNIIRNSEIPPMVNQIKVHPGSSAAVTLKGTLSRNITAMAYSPLGHGKTLSNPFILQLAQKYNVSPAQLCIKYVLQKGCCPVVKSSNHTHIESNANLDFTINDDDIKFLSCLGTIKNLKKHKL